MVGPRTTRGRLALALAGIGGAVLLASAFSSWVQPAHVPWPAYTDGVPDFISHPSDALFRLGAGLLGAAALVLVGLARRGVKSRLSWAGLAVLGLGGIGVGLAGFTTVEHYPGFGSLVANDMTLAAGVYALSVPAQSMTAGPADPAFVHFNIPTTNVQQALAASGTRYAIRIPKPEAYFVAGRSQSRYGSTYPPTSNQGDHATAAALRYTVPSTSWISVTGTTDTGPFNTFLLQVDTPFIRFVIDPAQADDPADTCDTHSRTSFSELTGLLAVGLYVDFPGYSAGCQGNDIQQKSRVRKRSSIPTSLSNRMAAAWNADLDSDTRRAGMSDDGVGMFVLKLVSGNGKTRIHALSSMLFFAHGGMDCKAPIVTSP